MSEYVDLADPATYSRGFPSAHFRELRSRDPLPWHFSNYERRGYWIVMTGEHMDYITRHPELFSSEAKTIMLTDPEDDELARLRKLLLNMDPPQHERYRRIISRAFNAQNIETLRGKAARIAREKISAVLHRGECDFVSDVSEGIPLLVIAEMLGIDREDIPSVDENARKVILSVEPNLQDPPAAVRAAGGMLLSHAMKLFSRQRRDPSTAMSAALLDDRINGEALTLEEFGFFFLLMMVAGVDTTRSTMCNSVRLLLEHPEQYQALQQDPSLLDNAIEEVLRYEPASFQMCRTATQSISMGGKTIEPGQKLALMLHAVNRDEALNPSPELFDIRRTKIKHRTFGHGIHVCIGAKVARLEVRALLHEMLCGMRNPRFASEYRRLSSRNINGYAEMRIRYESM